MAVRKEKEMSDWYKETFPKITAKVATAGYVLVGIITLIFLVIKIGDWRSGSQSSVPTGPTPQQEAQALAETRERERLASLASEVWVASWSNPSGEIHQMGRPTIKEFLYDRNFVIQSFEVEIQPRAGSPAFETPTTIRCTSASRCTYINRGFNENMSISIIVNRESLITGTLGPNGRTSSFCLYREADFGTDPCPPVHRMATAH